jgi:hypothetical protein
LQGARHGPTSSTPAILDADRIGWKNRDRFRSRFRGRFSSLVVRADVAFASASACGSRWQRPARSQDRHSVLAPVLSAIGCGQDAASAQPSPSCGYESPCAVNIRKTAGTGVSDKPPRIVQRSVRIAASPSHGTRRRDRSRPGDPDRCRSCDNYTFLEPDCVGAVRSPAITLATPSDCPKAIKTGCNQRRAYLILAADYSSKRRFTRTINIQGNIGILGELGECISRVGSPFAVDFSRVAPYTLELSLECAD